MAEVVAEVAEVAEMPTQMSPRVMEMSAPILGEKMELSTELTEMTPGEAVASSLFFQFMCSECGNLYNTLDVGLIILACIRDIFSFVITISFFKTIF